MLSVQVLKVAIDNINFNAPILVVKIPPHAPIVDIQRQDGRLFFWFEADDEDDGEREFFMVKTGEPLKKPLSHIKTLFVRNLTIHFYEEYSVPF